MKSIIVLTAFFTVLFTGVCFAQSQTDGKRPKPPTIEERLKMVNEKICQPLKLDESQTKKVSNAFKDFFTEIEKLIDFKTNPPLMPEKSKIDALSKIRDTKVKKYIPENLFDKYVELEKTTRRPPPGMTEENGPKK